MGAANVIPGVSGGTIALVTGIYEELIESLKSFNLQAFKYIIKLTAQGPASRSKKKMVYNSGGLVSAPPISGPTMHIPVLKTQYTDPFNVNVV